MGTWIERSANKRTSYLLFFTQPVVVMVVTNMRSADELNSFPLVLRGGKPDDVSALKFYLRIP